jgi:hypothetical protein
VKRHSSWQAWLSGLCAIALLCLFLTPHHGSKQFSSGDSCVACCALHEALLETNPLAIVAPRGVVVSSYFRYLLLCAQHPDPSAMSRSPPLLFV